MTALAKHEPPSSEVADYTGGLLAVIERAARDPSVDIDKMERLLAMQERVQERLAKQAFTEAKLAMRPELPEVTRKGHIIIKDKSGNITQDTEFARFEDLHDAVIPVITRHNFDLKFKNGMSPEGKVRIITILSHVAGHEDETYFDLPHDSSGSKNAVQAVGSSTSYGKRYGLLAILNIKVVGEDDDGSTASYKDPKGEPLARTKLDGPHTSKSALKQAVQQLRNQVRECVEAKQLNELLKSAKETIEQAEHDWASLLSGDPDLPEDIGLRGEVEKRRAELRNTGTGFATLLASMRESDSLAAMHRWRAANETEIEGLDGAQGRHFEREWEATESALLEKGVK